MSELTQLERARQCYAAGKFGQAEALCRSLLQLEPTCAEALYLLGLIAAEANQAQAALALVGQALEQDPKQPDWYQTLAQLLLNLGHTSTALQVYEVAQTHCPNHPELQAGRSRLLLLLGDTAIAEGEADKALEVYQQALDTDPALHEAVAERYVQRGELSKALSHLAQAQLSAEPRPDLASREIFLQLALPGAESQPESIKKLMQNWEQRFGQANLSLPPAQNPDPERKLRVGYVSGDFCQRSAVLMHALLLAHHDPQQVDVFAYANVTSPDQTTERLKQLVPNWRDIYALSDQAAAEQIKADQIDILIDLNGHSQGNRLGVFVLRPAAIQLTGLGFLAPTGLSAFTGRVTDPELSPAGIQVLEPEYPICRVLHWRTPADDVPLSPLPLLQRGSVSFVSGNNLYKLTETVIQTWCLILAACPDARLLLKTPELDEPEICEAITARFVRAGLEPDRLVLIGSSSHQQQLEFYSQGDIALDPFPYQGGFSCCEPLWMGLPVIALRGGTRTADSVLTAINRQQWLAENPEAYIRLAVELAQDHQQLKAEREGLRQLVASSALIDGEAYARELEALYRKLWQAAL